MNGAIGTAIAILQKAERDIERQRDEQSQTIASLLGSMREIAAIRPDDHENGLRLAVRIAQAAVAGLEKDGWP